MSPFGKETSVRVTPNSTGANAVGCPETLIKNISYFVCRVACPEPATTYLPIRYQKVLPEDHADNGMDFGQMLMSELPADVSSNNRAKIAQQFNR